MMMLFMTLPLLVFNLKKYFNLMSINNLDHKNMFLRLLKIHNHLPNGKKTGRRLKFRKNPTITDKIIIQNLGLLSQSSITLPINLQLNLTIHIIQTIIQTILMLIPDIWTNKILFMEWLIRGKIILIKIQIGIRAPTPIIHIQGILSTIIML